MIMRDYSANLMGVLLPTDKFLNLSHRDLTALIAIVPDGEDIFLTIRDNAHVEYVMVTNQCGTLVLTRGLGGTEPTKFPFGSCVKFELSITVVEWLICNHNCCEGDCPCTPVTSAGSVLPPAYVGVPWEGSFVFNGSVPMAFGVDGMPSWMNAEYGANYVRVFGTPFGAGQFSFAVSATNCDSVGSAAATGTVVVSATVQSSSADTVAAAGTAGTAVSVSPLALNMEMAEPEAPKRRRRAKAATDDLS